MRAGLPAVSAADANADTWNLDANARTLMAVVAATLLISSPRRVIVRAPIHPRPARPEAASVLVANETHLLDRRVIAQAVATVRHRGCESAACRQNSGADQERNCKASHGSLLWSATYRQWTKYLDAASFHAIRMSLQQCESGNDAVGLARRGWLPRPRLLAQAHVREAVAAGWMGDEIVKRLGGGRLLSRLLE